MGGAQTCTPGDGCEDEDATAAPGVGVELPVTPVSPHLLEESATRSLQERPLEVEGSMCTTPLAIKQPLRVLMFPSEKPK